jgi:hypothetical protein
MNAISNPPGIQKSSILLNSVLCHAETSKIQEKRGHPLYPEDEVIKKAAVRLEFDKIFQ